MPERLVGGRTLTERHGRQPDRLARRARAPGRSTRTGWIGRRREKPTIAKDAAVASGVSSFRADPPAAPTSDEKIGVDGQERDRGGLGRRPARRGRGWWPGHAPGRRSKVPLPRSTKGSPGPLGQVCRSSPDAAPRLAGDQSGTIDSTGLGTGRTTVQTGCDNGQHGAGNRRPRGLGQLGIERRDRAGPPVQPGHPPHAGQVTRPHGEPIRIGVSQSRNAVSGLGAEGFVNEPLERRHHPGRCRAFPATSAPVPDGSPSRPRSRSRRRFPFATGPGSCEGLDHATLHGLANLGMEGMIGRPVDPPLAIESNQSAALRLGRIGRRQPRQRLAARRTPAPARGNIPDAPRLGGSFPSRSGPVESSSACPSRARRMERSVRVFGQNHGRRTAISQVFRQVARGRQGVARDRLSAVGTQGIGPSQIESQRPDVRRARLDQVGRRRHIIELRERDRTQTDRRIGTAVDQEQDHLRRIGPNQPV